MMLTEIGYNYNNKQISQYLKDLVENHQMINCGCYYLNVDETVDKWIDLEKLFSLDNRKFLEPVTDCIAKNIIFAEKKSNEQNKNESSSNKSIIGINYYGAILASIIGYKYNCPFSYYFDKRSFVDEIEKEVQNFETDNIIIILDVMIYGNTICSLINMLWEKHIISEKTKIEVIVLFERKWADNSFSKAYSIPYIKKIYVLNDSFNVNITVKKK